MLQWQCADRLFFDGHVTGGIMLQRQYADLSVVDGHCSGGIRSHFGSSGSSGTS